MSTSTSSVSVPGFATLQMGFLALLPRLEAHARFAFRLYRCSHDRDDAVAEVVGLCWAWYRRLAQRGKDAAAFATALALWAVLKFVNGLERRR